MTDDDHERWAELAAGHLLSGLDPADEAAYVEHAATCEQCHRLERELAETLAELSPLAPAMSPPPALKASIMRAVADEEAATGVVPLDARRAEASAAGAPNPARVRRRPPAWLTAAAAVVVLGIGGGAIAWSAVGHGRTSVTARCAAQHCPTVQLSAEGQPVATVMVLDGTAYVQLEALPQTPNGSSYVLWRMSAGQQPVGVAAFRTQPGAGPVKAGELGTSVSDVTAFALSQEPGDTVPAAPTHVLAQGTLTRG